jgi:CcmD family protein
MRNFWSLFAAYMISWAIFFGFLLMLSVRLRRVQDDLKRLKDSLRRD